MHKMSLFELDEPGKKVLLMGNEAIARGALEAGVNFCSGYPGNPASEVVEALAKAAKKFDIYVEWSVNEIVALEAAGAAAATGLRSLTAMKNLGADVCSDFLMTVNLSGTKGGFVMVTGDDPFAHSTTTELDTRNYARFADIPLLEPSTAQEAKDMTKFAFELSEELGVICMIRTVTRLSYARGVVTLGQIPREKRVATFSSQEMWTSGSSSIACMFHGILHEKMGRAQRKFEESEFNKYVGREDADFIIITSGTGWPYSLEAVKLLGLQDKAGILKLGTTWPLPEKLIAKHLKHAKEVLFVEEIDPFLEQNVKMLAADLLTEGIGPIKFYGKKSDHVRSEFGAGTGEIDVDTVIRALTEIKGLEYLPREKGYSEKASTVVGSLVPARTMGLCAGCPHRASFWAIKKALQWDGRDGIVTGDIGCYSLGLLPTGFSVAKTLHCMGAGIGTANGFGKLAQFGLDKPVIAISGDSTFYHACIPALVNAKWHNANILYIILDNNTTAMTGHQPHPGTGADALGNLVQKISMEDICKGIGVEVRVQDPFNIDDAVQNLYEMLQTKGTKVMIFRHECPLTETKKKEKKPKVYVDQDKCIGDECGCVRFCTRVFKCPGNIWDSAKGKAKIDEAVCTGCGLCADLCPAEAIVVEEVT
jgi:indolepyruvate ferredoxin oxidoreductase alpha subunit